MTYNKKRTLSYGVNPDKCVTGVFLQAGTTGKCFYEKSLQISAVTVFIWECIVPG